MSDRDLSKVMVLVMIMVAMDRVNAVRECRSDFRFDGTRPVPRTDPVVIG